MDTTITEQIVEVTVTDDEVVAVNVTSLNEVDPVYEAEKDTLALKTEIPTKTSDLENDSGFITSASSETDPVFTASEAVNFETGDKNKLDTALQAETDPVFTGWDKSYDDLSDKPTIPTDLADLADDTTHRVVTDDEKGVWNGKQPAGSYELTTNKENTTLDEDTTKYPTNRLVKSYADGLINSANALVYKGVIDCALNPNYPASDCGHLYVVSVAGKIGGVSGVDVEVGDMCICNTDSTASGDQATVGTKWNILEKNVSGIVTGPASAVGDNVALFDGLTGKVVKDSGAKLSDYQPAMGDDDNYVTDIEKSNLHAPESDNQDLSGLVPKSAFGVKGDILVGTGAGTYASVGIGSDGEALVADSGQASGVDWDTVGGAYIRGATKVVASSTSLDKVNVDYVCDGTDDEVQIQSAIDAVTATGGTVFLMEGTYNIHATPICPKANVILQGTSSYKSAMGTIIKLVAGQTNLFKTVNATITNFSWKNITFDLSSINGSSILGYTANYPVTNLTLIECGGIGLNGGSAVILFQNQQATGSSIVDKCWFNNARIMGKLNGSSGTLGYRVTYDKCKFENIYTGAGETLISDYYVKITNCVFVVNNTTTTSNIVDGCNLAEISNNSFVLVAQCRLFYNVAYWVVYGNDIVSAYNGTFAPTLITAGSGIFVANRFNGNGSYPFAKVFTLNSANYPIVITGNYFTVCTIGIDFTQRAKASIVGNSFAEVVNSITASSGIVCYDNATIIGNTTGEGTTGTEEVMSWERRIVRMRNTSGVTSTQGHLVILDATANGNRYTTTTTIGDNRVVGMVQIACANTYSGTILKEGLTNSLKVKGNTDIAIGDYICCSDTAGIGQKAGSGHTAIAIALEAYTGDDNNGVIDAVLIPPRYIA